MIDDETRAEERTVVGVFDSPSDAEAALDGLRVLGVHPEHVSVVMRDRAAAEELAADSGANVAGGAATGAISGGLLGGVAGWLVGIGALAIPGIGPVLGAGVLASVLTGAAIGAAAGGLLGALVGLGVPEEEARTYETYVREGRVLVTVQAVDDTTAVRARETLEQANAYDVRSYGVPLAPAQDLGTDLDAGAAQAEYDYDRGMTMAEEDLDAAESVENVVEDLDDGDLPPERQPLGPEAAGGAGGAVIGGLIGAVIGGPAGAAVGAALGAGAGAGAAHVTQEPGTLPIGSPIGGGAGAVVGGIIGAAGGPVGAVVGAALGGAVGGATGEALQDAGEFVQERFFADRDAGGEGGTTTAGEQPAGVAAWQETATGPAPADLGGRTEPAAGEGAATIPTEYRSGGEGARSATPEQLAGAASRDLEPEPAGQAPGSGAITPGTTETEYRSGGDASRGETT